MACDFAGIFRRAFSALGVTVAASHTRCLQYQPLQHRHRLSLMLHPRTLRTDSRCYRESPRKSGLAGRRLLTHLQTQTQLPRASQLSRELSYSDKLLFRLKVLEISLPEDCCSGESYLQCNFFSTSHMHDLNQRCRDTGSYDLMLVLRRGMDNDPMPSYHPSLKKQTNIPE